MRHALHSHKFGSHVQLVHTSFCIVGVYILHKNPILTLSISLHGKVLSPNDGHFLLSETFQVILLAHIT